MITLIKNKTDIKDTLNSFKEFLDEEYRKFNIPTKDEKEKILNLRRNSRNFLQDFKDLSKWDIRSIMYYLIEEAKINLEEDNIKKIIFFVFSDVLNEEFPNTSPLIFKYRDTILVKKHPILLDFNLIPELVEKINNLNDEKIHAIVLNLFNYDKLLIDGISKYISNLNFAILNILDRILYEEVIPFNEIFIKEGDNFSIDKTKLDFIIENIFNSISEYVLPKEKKFKVKHKKENRALKIKKIVKEILEDEKEKEYIFEVANIDEESFSGRLLQIRDYNIQKNVFENARFADIDNTEKIENILFLIGITNINPILLIRYFDGDDILYTLHKILRNAQDNGFLTDRLIKAFELFLFKLFKYPYISERYFNKDILDKAFKYLFSDNKELSLNYLYFTRKYKEFLDNFGNVELSPELQLKQLLAKHFTNEFNKDELLSWLVLIPKDEAYFIFHLLKKSLDMLPQNNEYKYIAEVYNMRTPKEHIIDAIGEEGFYTLVARILGIYPYDKTLENLFDITYL
jgi:hypothetical protein